MDFDKLQKVWQQVQNGSKLVIDPDILIREIKGNRKAFESFIFRRNAIQFVAGIIAAGIFLYGALKFDDSLFLTGSLLAMAIVALYLGIFLTVDRAIQQRKSPKHTESLLDCINAYLTQINHEILLLRKSLWWSLIPADAAVTLYLINVFWYRASHDWITFILFSIIIIILILLNWWAYRYNQSVVKKGLIRKDELDQILISLKGNHVNAGL